jgi:putative DNA primase/helicase
VNSFAPTFDQVRAYFEDRLGVSLQARNEVQVRCKFHDDEKPSMSISFAKGTWKCHACNVGGGILDFERKLTGKQDAECWAAINTTIGRDGPKHKQIDATYDYTDAAGTLVFQSVRYAEPKDFRQRRPNGKGGWIWDIDGVIRYLFNLPALVRANVVLIAEGEKDALNLQKAAAGLPDEDGKLSYAATCNIGGAGKWLDSYSPFCAGKRAFVFQDNDEPGRKHAQQVSVGVSKHAQAVHLVKLPGLAEHGDVSDYLETHTPAELFELMQSAPVWTPSVGATQPSIAPGNGFNLVGLGDLLSRPDVEVDYLLDGMLVRGTVSCVVSKPKVGKSTLARGLCLAVARGTTFLGRKIRQGPCIYLALEERAEEIASDFRAMGADGTEPIQIHADAVPEAAILSLLDLVRRACPALVIIDPLFRLARIRDGNAYAETYSALGPLIDIARETGTHILCLHHSSKLAKAEAIDSPIGSTALGGAASTLIFMKRTESYRTMQTVQPIGADLPESVLMFDPSTRLLSLGGLRESFEVADVGGAIVRALADKSMTEPEIDDAIKGKTTSKRRALREQIRLGTVVRSGTGKRGDPFCYDKACSIVPAREEEIENKKPNEVDPKNRMGMKRRLFPLSKT